MTGRTAYAIILIFCVSNDYGWETSEPARGDELLNTSHRFTLQEKQAQSWQDFWNHLNGDVIERMSDVPQDVPCLLIRNAQRLHSSELAEECQPLDVVHFALPTLWRVVLTEGKTVYVGKHRGRLAEHLGYV